MQTKRLRVREARNEDLPRIEAIAAVNGMEGWTWPAGTWGVVAILNDEVIAFAAAREITSAWLVEELWSVPNHDGVRGLSALSEWIEFAAKEEYKKSGNPKNIAGFVFPHNFKHHAALIKRGYKHHADILSKSISI